MPIHNITHDLSPFSYRKIKHRGEHNQCTNQSPMLFRIYGNQFLGSIANKMN